MLQMPMGQRCRASWLQDAVFRLHSTRRSCNHRSCCCQSVSSCGCQTVHYLPHCCRHCPRCSFPAQKPSLPLRRQWLQLAVTELPHAVSAAEGLKLRMRRRHHCSACALFCGCYEQLLLPPALGLPYPRPVGSAADMQSVMLERTLPQRQRLRRLRRLLCRRFHYCLWHCRCCWCERSFQPAPCRRRQQPHKAGSLRHLQTEQLLGQGLPWAHGAAGLWCARSTHLRQSAHRLQLGAAAACRPRHHHGCFCHSSCCCSCHHWSSAVQTHC